MKPEYIPASQVPMGRPRRKTSMVCQHCGSTDIIRDGIFYRKREKTTNQKYRCKKCGRYTKDPSEFRMRHTKEVVDAAVKLSETLSLRDVAAELYIRFQIKLSHVTASAWIAKEQEKRGLIIEESKIKEAVKNVTPLLSPEEYRRGIELWNCKKCNAVTKHVKVAGKYPVRMCCGVCGTER